MEGYSERAVSDLELYLERDLPGRHRELLLTIGKNLGFPTGDFHLDPAEVVALVTNRDAFPEYLVPLAVDGSVDDARVVRIAAGGPITDAPLPRAHSVRCTSEPTPPGGAINAPRRPSS